MGLDHGFTSAKSGAEIVTLRKANHIHNWMCDNTVWDDDKMNGDIHAIPVADIKKLIEVSEKVLNDHKLAQTLLPRSRGFFFGSQEYDEWYFEDVKDTYEALKGYLDENPDATEVNYWAWW